MREIEFRFWVDGANGEFMIYPDNRENSNFNSEGWEFYLDDEGFEIINHRGVVEPAHHVPMQYTGLKDKNGVDVFEGDYLSWISFESHEEFKGEVVFSKGSFCMVIRLKGHDYKVPLHELSESDNLIEVLGNIYENPELLEVAE